MTLNSQNFFCSIPAQGQENPSLSSAAPLPEFWGSRTDFAPPPRGCCAGIEPITVFGCAYRRSSPGKEVPSRRWQRTHRCLGCAYHRLWGSPTSFAPSPPGPIAVSDAPTGCSALGKSRNRRALILGWAYYLDAFSSYPLRTWLPSVYRWHDNWHTRGASFPVLSY